MRKLAHIEKIIDIQPIPNADKIEVATVLGWKVVSKKDEFKVGDKIIYIEIDSRVPKDEPYFSFLAERNYKVKSIKLRKQVSQGLIVPISLLPDGDYQEGDDVTDILKITKIEEDYKQPPVNKELQLKQRHKKLYNKKWFKYMMKYAWFRKLAFKFLLPKKRKTGWPSWITKTDEERVQNMPWILENKSQFFCTEKLDGTSSTFSLKKEGMKWKFYVCSRNVVQDTPGKKCYYEDLGNVYWEMAKKYDIENKLRAAVKEYNVKDYITLQGEIIGEGIQKNKYELKGRDLYLFNLIVDDVKYNPVQVAAFALSYDMKAVPILETEFVLPDTVDELMEFATGNSTLHNTLREGIVFRSHDMNTSFKCVSNKFLLKWGL